MPPPSATPPFEVQFNAEEETEITVGRRRPQLQYNPVETPFSEVHTRSDAEGENKITHAPLHQMPVLVHRRPVTLPEPGESRLVTPMVQPPQLVRKSPSSPPKVAMQSEAHYITPGLLPRTGVTGIATAGAHASPPQSIIVDPWYESERRRGYAERAREMARPPLHGERLSDGTPSLLARMRRSIARCPPLRATLGLVGCFVCTFGWLARVRPRGGWGRCKRFSRLGFIAKVTKRPRVGEPPECITAFSRSPRPAYPAHRVPDVEAGSLPIWLLTSKLRCRAHSTRAP